MQQVASWMSRCDAALSTENTYPTYKHYLACLYPSPSSFHYPGGYSLETPGGTLLPARTGYITDLQRRGIFGVYVLHLSNTSSQSSLLFLFLRLAYRLTRHLYTDQLQGQVRFKVERGTVHIDFRRDTGRKTEQQ